MTLTVIGARGLVTEGWDKEAFHQLPCIFCILNYVKNKIGEIKTKRFFIKILFKKTKNHRARVMHTFGEGSSLCSPF